MLVRVNIVERAQRCSARPRRSCAPAVYRRSPRLPRRPTYREERPIGIFRRKSSSSPKPRWKRYDPASRHRFRILSNRKHGSKRRCARCKNKPLPTSICCVPSSASPSGAARRPRRRELHAFAAVVASTGSKVPSRRSARSSESRRSRSSFLRFRSALARKRSSFCATSAISKRAPLRIFACGRHVQFCALR